MGVQSMQRAKKETVCVTKDISWKKIFAFVSFLVLHCPPLSFKTIAKIPPYLLESVSLIIV